MTTAGDQGLARAIAGVARSLQSRGGVQATLQEMVDLAVRTVPGCEHAGVSIVRDGQVSTPAASDDVPRHVDQLQYETGQGPCLEAIDEHAVFTTGELLGDGRWPRFSARATAETGVRSALSFRLFVAHDTLGALNLYSRRADAFAPRSHLVGEVFAAHAAVALAGAREHDLLTDLRHDLHAARARDRQHTDQVALAVALQRSLLADLPRLDHLESAALYRPAERGHEVGGDWYDLFTLPDGATAVTVGDTTGHDVRAATSMGALRNLLRGIAWDRCAPPSEVVTRLDAAVRGLAVPGLATLVHGRLQRAAHRPGGAGADGEDGETGGALVWTNAGHPPPVLLAPDGAVQLLAGSDLLLGVQADAPRSDRVAPFPAGSTLLLYTDGLVERRGEDLGAGIRRLSRALSPLARAPLPALVEEVAAELVGDSVEDDTAVLAVRLTHRRG